MLVSSLKKNSMLRRLKSWAYDNEKEPRLEVPFSFLTEKSDILQVKVLAYFEGLML